MDVHAVNAPTFNDIGCALCRALCSRAHSLMAVNSNSRDSISRASGAFILPTTRERLYYNPAPVPANRKKFPTPDFQIFILNTKSLFRALP